MNIEKNSNTSKKTSAVNSSLLVIIVCVFTLYFHCNGPVTPFTNGLPVCSDIALQTTDAAPVNIDIQATDPDGDYIGWKIIQHPVLGSVNKTGGSVGAGYEFVYTSRNILADSVETLVVAVSDWMDTLQYKQINVIIEITAADNPPVAQNGTVDVYRNAGLIDMPGFDPEGLPVTWKIITPPSHGTIDTINDTVSSALEAFYIPNNSSTAHDEFTYRVYTNTDSSQEGTVTLQMKNAYLLQQGVPFQGPPYAGCEDTYLKVRFKVGYPETVIMVNDSLTNYSAEDTLFLNH